MDTLPAGAYAYRPLRKGDGGWDVFALQSALAVSKDGAFGPVTDKAVRDYQTSAKLTVDGIAGIATQMSLALKHVWPVQAKHETPAGLIRGQVEKESGFQLGNHSARRTTDGTHNWDVGPTQRNTLYASLQQGFDVPGSVAFLGNHLRRKHDEYASYSEVGDERRLWELAAGSWNAPAWADRLAKGQSLSESQRTWLEAYISRVTIYMKV